MSLNILRLLSDKEQYENYSHLIKDHVLVPDVLTIFKDMETYYHQGHTEVDWLDFSTWFKMVKHPTLKPEKVELFDKIFDKLINEEGSEEDEDRILEILITRDYATQIYAKAGEIAEGACSDSLDDIGPLLDSYHMDMDKIAEEDSKLVTDDLEDILGYVTGEGGLDWRLDFFNQSLGPLKVGDFITIGKRPDSGGTTMLASEATFMASQLPEDLDVLWFNNEESGKKVKFRIIQAALGWTMAQIEKDWTVTLAEYEKAVGRADRIKVFDTCHHIRDVEQRLKKYKPGLIIIDQLWNMNGFEKISGNEVTRQGLLFKQAREWAGEYAPVINVHQADGTAEGQDYIDMSQMYGSKTAIQAHCDAIITIGRVTTPGMEMSRFLYVPKNKLMGGDHRIETMRHGKAEVTIEPEIARFS